MHERSRDLRPAGRAAAWAKLGGAVVALGAAAMLLAGDLSALPDNDYWSLISTVTDAQGVHLVWARLLDTSNEHLVLLPKLVYVLNYVLTGGDNRALVALVWLFATFTALLLAGMLARSARERDEALFLGIVAGACAFTPAAAHNFFMGFSGVSWLGANLLTLVALRLGLAAQERARPLLWIAAALAALGAALSYSTGLPAPLLLGLLALSQPRSRRIGLALLGGGAVLLALIFAHQPRVEAHGAFNYDVVQLTRYALTFLGGWTRTAGSAMWVGLAGVVAGVLLLWRRRQALFDRDGAVWFWALLAAYAACSAAMAAVGRSRNFPLDAALDSRYMTLPVLYWLALLGGALAGLRSREADQRTRLRLLVVASAIATAVVVAGRTEIGRLRDHAAAKNQGAVAMLAGTPSPALLGSVDYAADQLVAVLPQLRGNGHVPFNGLYPLCPASGTKLELAEPALPGALDGALWLDASRALSLNGWAAGADRQPVATASRDRGMRCVALVDGDGVVQGLALGELPRPDVKEYLHASSDAFGWAGSTAPLPERIELSGAAYDPADARWHRLAGARIRVDGQALQRSDD